jgi:hypothetical protein
MTVKLFEGCYGRTLGGRIRGPVCLWRSGIHLQFFIRGESYKENGSYNSNERPCEEDIISLCNADGSDIIQPIPEYDPVKVKAVVDAARRVAFGSCMNGSPYSDLQNALKAIVPPKRKVYTMPEYNELTENGDSWIAGGYGIPEDFYNAIREALAKKE